MGHTTGNGKKLVLRIRTLTNGSTEAEEDWQADGAVCGNVAGTYVHGLFENGSLTKICVVRCFPKRESVQRR